MHGSISNQTGTVFVVLGSFLSTQEIKCHAILPFYAELVVIGVLSVRKF